MAGQTEAIEQSRIPYGVMSYSLSDAICNLGVPTLAIGLAAAAHGLAQLTIGEGTPHFSWDKKALDKLGIKTLETLLINLREAAGTQ